LGKAKSPPTYLTSSSKVEKSRESKFFKESQFAPSAKPISVSPGASVSPNLKTFSGTGLVIKAPT
jgi:hypothetical protein